MSAERVCTMQEERRTQTKGPPAPPPPDPHVTDDTAIEALSRSLQSLQIGNDSPPPIETILAAIESGPEIDPMLSMNEPRTWAEAQKLPDAKKWQLAYQEELKSLKDLEVYRLIPWSQVPAGTKI
jgi:hypothetical protein